MEEIRYRTLVEKARKYGLLTGIYKYAEVNKEELRELIEKTESNCDKEIEKKKEFMYYQLDRYDKSKIEYNSFIERGIKPIPQKAGIGELSLEELAGIALERMKDAEFEILGNLREIRELEKVCELKKL